MNVRSFLDTNVLAYTDDHDAPAKQRRALELVEEARTLGLGVVSTQVLQEYFVTATRKLGVEVGIASRKTQLFSRLQVVVIDVPDIDAAIDLHRVHQISFWDALVLRAATRAACAVLLSEDLQHGSVVAGVTIENPFAELEGRPTPRSRSRKRRR